MTVVRWRRISSFATMFILTLRRTIYSRYAYSSKYGFQWVLIHYFTYVTNPSLYLLLQIPKRKLNIDVSCDILPYLAFMYILYPFFKFLCLFRVSIQSETMKPRSGYKHSWIVDLSTSSHWHWNSIYTRNETNLRVVILLLFRRNLRVWVSERSIDNPRNWGTRNAVEQWK